jgi:hypothetical protein
MNQPVHMNQPTYMSQPAQMLAKRPKLVTFSAVMMFIAFGFQVMIAIYEFANAIWLSNGTYGDYGGYLWIWGIFDLLFAGILFYTGYDILKGGKAGFVWGTIFSGFNAVRWFFFLPQVPIMSIVFIAIDIIVIYGLISNSEYFAQSP